MNASTLASLVTTAFDRSTVAMIWGGTPAAHRSLRRLERQQALRPGCLDPVLRLRHTFEPAELFDLATAIRAL
jgi:hypothetical protein